MAEALESLLALHPDRAQLPPRAAELLERWNLEGPEWVMAWHLSGLVPGPELRTPLFALSLALLAAQAQGHTRLALAGDPGGIAEQVLQAFGLQGLDAQAFLDGPGLEGLVGREGDARPLVFERPWLYSQRLLAAETALDARIVALAGTALAVTEAPPEAVFADPEPLNAQQCRAVRMALGGALTLVTGGPGTGKTSIVAAILRALLHQPGLRLEDIALAAPTGKAAQRMGQAIQRNLGRAQALPEAEQPLVRTPPKPGTLHMLLSWHPAQERFRHGPGDPLPAKVVIVDEASMVSQAHMARLLGALGEGARLILLGDARQLPSVEEGCVFRDMVAALAANTVELTVNYRMRPEDPNGMNILSVANNVRDNQVQALWEGQEPIHSRATLAEVRHAQVELLDPGEGRLEAFASRWFEQQVTGLPGFKAKAGRTYHCEGGQWPEGDLADLGALFKHFDGFRILCALREAGGLRGVQDLNRFCHRRMLDLTGEGLKGALFCAGEPILMTTNDYRRGIFNGDQGLVLKVETDGQLRQAAVFPRGDGFAAFLLEPLKTLVEHAYAMTVHKSQGSEYDRIAIVLPRTDHKALTQELLYTGITRARTGVALLAERERIPFAAGHPTVRESGLAERLGRSLGTGGPLC